MEQHEVRIRSIAPVTHDVIRIVTDKPEGFAFIPGQATELAINKEGWVHESRPFTFNCLPSDDHLEFTIKTYPDHKGVTNELLTLKPGDGLILHDVFGTITYQGEGVFIAGGAGVTPFISIFRWLRYNHMTGQNTLLFANKTKADIILEKEFRDQLGHHFINVLSAELVPGYIYGHISRELLHVYLQDDSKKIYLCGPDPMMEAMEKHFIALGIDSQRVIREAF